MIYWLHLKPMVTLWFSGKQGRRKLQHWDMPSLCGNSDNCLLRQAWLSIVCGLSITQPGLCGTPAFWVNFYLRSSMVALDLNHWPTPPEPSNVCAEDYRKEQLPVPP